MIVLPIDFQERLSSPLSFLCRAWIVTPKTGEKIRVSEHDREIEIGGHKFNALNGFDGGTLEIQQSLGADRTSITASLNAQGISKEAILLGKYDQAIVEMIVFDWKEPQYFVKVWEGLVGRAIIHDFGFEFELIGPEAKLNKAIGRKFTKLCSAKLGDTDCKIDINHPQFVVLSTILNTVSQSELEVSNIDTIDIASFEGGEIEFQNGIWSGFRVGIERIELNENAKIYLKTPLPVLPQLNDEIRIIMGCDRTFECCKTRFQNAANFLGFPHMPGEGIIYASP